MGAFRMKQVIDLLDGVGERPKPGLRLDAYAMLLLLVIANRYDDAAERKKEPGQCWGARDTLFTLARMSRAKFWRCKKSLVDSGILVYREKMPGVDKRTNRPMIYTNVYQINFTELEKLHSEATEGVSHRDSGGLSQRPEGSLTETHGRLSQSPIQYKENSINNTITNKGDGGGGDLVECYRKYIATALGIGIALIHPKTIAERVVGKNWKDVKAIVEDIARQRKAKAEAGTPGGPNDLIGIMFSKIGALPSATETLGGEELQQRLFAPPEPVAVPQAPKNTPDELWERFVAEFAPDGDAAARKGDFIDLFGRIDRPQRREDQFTRLRNEIAEAREKEAKAPLALLLGNFLAELKDCIEEE